MASGLEFRLYPESEKDFDIIASILNKTWASLIEVTPEIIKKRLGSGSLFIFGYKEDLPISVLETVGIKTKGIFDNVPKTYNRLTNNGLWLPPSENADTIMLVDITSGIRCDGVGTAMIDFSLEYIAKKTYYKHAWTYTPNQDMPVKWHINRGAIDTNFVLENARPNYPFPDVGIMDYTRKMLSFRPL